MHEARAFHSFIREKFVDGLHQKLSASKLSNNPSTCLSASDILSRKNSTRATTPAKQTTDRRPKTVAPSTLSHVGSSTTLCRNSATAGFQATYPSPYRLDTSKGKV
jgi:hypothetical protein